MLKKKWLRMIIITMLMVAMLITTVGLAACDANRNNSDEEYLPPQASLTILEEALNIFRTIDIVNEEEITVYTDCFAGSWHISRLGVWGIGVVANDYYIDSLNYKANFNGQVVYVRKEFSYNFLLKIFEALSNSDYRSSLGIISLSFSGKCNYIVVGLSNRQNTDGIIEYLQRIDLYEYGAVYFTIGTRRPSGPFRGVSYALIIGLIILLVLIVIAFIIKYLKNPKD